MNTYVKKLLLNNFATYRDI